MAALFDPGPGVPPEKLSADRKRTIRNRAMIDVGYHPVTGLPLLTDIDRTCGTCTHSGRQGGVAGRYWKCCAQDGRYITGGPATDIRLKWPACVLWEAD